jgi:hypothetical protein
MLDPACFSSMGGYACGVGTCCGVGAGSLAGGGWSSSQPMAANMLKSSSNVDNNAFM